MDLLRLLEAGSGLSEVSYVSLCRLLLGHVRFTHVPHRVQLFYDVEIRFGITSGRRLVWGDGYYNGVIKTRKTIHARELSPEEFGLQRSQQLRDLYITLLTANKNGQQQASKPFALKPEDLAETEWFFFLCMSFSFDEGVGYMPFYPFSNDNVHIPSHSFCEGGLFMSRSVLCQMKVINS